MTALIDTGQIASILGVEREYVTDKLTKRPDFPRPEVDISQKLRRWNEADVLEWLRKKRHVRRAAMSEAVSR